MNTPHFGLNLNVVKSTGNHPDNISLIHVTQVVCSDQSQSALYNTEISCMLEKKKIYISIYQYFHHHLI